MKLVHRKYNKNNKAKLLKNVKSPLNGSVNKYQINQKINIYKKHTIVKHKNIQKNIKLK